MREADVDPLDAHDRTLPLDDLRYRFFGVFHPSRAFLEGRAGLASKGGFALVAVVTGVEERLVGEAEYVLLPDGDGELGISVTPGWRGWLGPYLLDALLETAAGDSRLAPEARAGRARDSGVESGTAGAGNAPQPIEGGSV